MPWVAKNSAAIAEDLIEGRVRQKLCYMDAMDITDERQQHVMQSFSTCLHSMASMC